jgi:hypothetical protein
MKILIHINFSYGHGNACPYQSICIILKVKWYKRFVVKEYIDLIQITTQYRSLKSKSRVKYNTVQYSSVKVHSLWLAN